MASRASVLARARTLGIELEIEVWRTGRSIRPGSHVHVEAPKGKAFRGSGLSNASLWDHTSPAIDWDAVDNSLSYELPLIDADPDLEDDP